MYEHYLAAIAVLASGNVLAQTIAPDNSTTPTAQGEITIHTITVGKISNDYDPQSVLAVPGDIVTFEFWSGNHSAIRAAYGYPCIPYEDVIEQPGFFSGFHSPNSGQPGTWNITINTTSPVFFYCGAPGSCIGHGMVGVINPNASTSLNTQIELSRQADYMLLPGQAVPEDAMQSMSSLAATATTATVTVTATNSVFTSGSSQYSYATTSSAAAPSSTAQDDPPVTSHSSGLSPGAIAGISVGAVAVAAIAAALFFFLGRTKTMKDELNRLRGRPAPNARDGGEAAAFMAAHGESEKHDHVAQLPPYQSPEMRHEEYRPPHSLGSKGVLVNPDIREVSASPYGGNQEQHRFSDSSELNTERSPQEMPSMHELYTPGTQDRRPLG
jgi:plastocyanin